MMPEEWPIAASAADRNVPARRAGRDRLSTVRLDFFLDSDARLTEQERALMTAMLHGLVGEIADEIRAALPLGWAPANDESNASLVSDLRVAGLLDEEGLMSLLLRRADEERIGTAARARSGAPEPRVIQGLVSHENGAVSAAAMALILARGRRRDRFGQYLVDFDDLPQASAEVLVNAVAAGLRRDLAGVRGAAAADAELCGAAGRLLARRDPSRGVDVLTTSLVRLLEQSASPANGLLLSAAQEGEVAFIVAVLGQRAAISASQALDELLSGNAPRVMALFRIAGFSRELAAGLLASIGDLLGIANPGAAIGIFDSLTDEQLRAASIWLGAAPGYRAALDSLWASRG